MSDKNRYSRQMKISWFNQKKINNTNCMVVGVGGIGTTTSILLTFLGIRKIVLVDMDKVEKSNLNRQMFYEEDVGKYKVDAMKDKLLKINPKLKIETFNSKIEEIPKSVFNNIHFVFDCLDNIKTREYIAKFCWDKKIPFIHSACSVSVGEVQLVVNGKTTPMREYPEEMKNEEERRSCLDYDASVCTTNMITASLQVDKFLDYIINKDVSKPFVSYVRNNSLGYSG